MEAVNQEPEAARASILEALPKAYDKVSDTRFRFEFLSSPIQMLGENGLLTQLEVEDTTLSLKENGDTKARGTGNKRLLDVETVIFAIGDKVDETFGLPTQWNEYVKNENPAFPIEGVSYEAFDPSVGKPIDGVFVGGWSRKASDGLVGYARKDGTNASKAVWGYLQTKQPDDSTLETVIRKVYELHKPAVTKDDIQRLEAVEQMEAQKRGLEDFKFASNEEMLRAMGLIIAA
jgi:ferredoxin--NADP+ reductase